MEFKTRKEVLDVLGKRVKLDECVSSKIKINNIVKIIAVLFTYPEEELYKHDRIMFWCKEDNGSYFCILNSDIERIMDLPPGMEKRPTYRD